MISKSVVVVLLLTVVCRITAFSQSFAGYGYDNYAGVNSMVLNPSSIADSRYKVNVNIFSISALAGNNAYEMDRSRLFSLKFSNMNEGKGFYKSTNTANKYFYQRRYPRAKRDDQPHAQRRCGHHHAAAGDR